MGEIVNNTASTDIGADTLLSGLGIIQQVYLLKFMLTHQWVGFTTFHHVSDVNSSVSVTGWLIFQQKLN